MNIAELITAIVLTCQVNVAPGFGSIAQFQLDCQKQILNCANEKIHQHIDREEALLSCVLERKL